MIQRCNIRTNWYIYLLQIKNQDLNLVIIKSWSGHQLRNLTMETSGHVKLLGLIPQKQKILTLVFTKKIQLLQLRLWIPFKASALLWLSWTSSLRFIHTQFSMKGYFFILIPFASRCWQFHMFIISKKKILY